MWSWTTSFWKTPRQAYLWRVPWEFLSSFFLKSHKCIISCEEKTFDCKYCDLKFHHPTGLYSHVRLKHNSLACKVCGTEFPTENALRVHQIVHYTDHRPFKCNECDASFKREAFLGRHKILVHNGGTKCYTCDICQQTFSDVNGLMMHSHPHSRKENLGCHICGKQVTNIPVLTSRMALHGHEHLFYCDTCTKMLIYDIRYSNKWDSDLFFGQVLYFSDYYTGFSSL